MKFSRGVVIIFALWSALVGCSAARDTGDGTPLSSNGHPSVTGDCALCHSQTRPASSLAVGVVAATSTTPGWQFFHTTQTVSTNDCVTCHTSNYIGLTDGWTHGQFGDRHSAITSNCRQCHQTPTGVITDSTRQTATARTYTIRFHNLTPTGFNEDPTTYNDCSVCHSHSAGFSAGNFGPVGGPHLADSLGNLVSRCTDCHDFPANFPSPPFPPNQHSTAQSLGYQCTECHLKPGQIGGTAPGGFGNL